MADAPILAYIFEIPSPEEDERFCSEARRLGVNTGSVIEGTRYFAIQEDLLSPLRQRGFVVQDSLSWGIAQREKAHREATPPAAGPGTPGESAPTTTITTTPALAVPALPAQGPGATTITTGPITPGQVLIVTGTDMGSSGQVLVYAGPVVVPPAAPVPADVQIPQATATPVAAPTYAPRPPTREVPVTLNIPTRVDLDAMIRVLPKVPPATQRGRLALAPGAYLYSINDQGQWTIVWHAQLDDAAKSAGEVLGPFGGDKHTGWQTATAAAAEHAKGKAGYDTVEPEPAGPKSAKPTRAPRPPKTTPPKPPAATGPTVAEYADDET